MASPTFGSTTARTESSYSMSARPSSPLAALAFYSGLTFFQSGISLLLLPLYVTALTPADYGVLVLVNVVGALFGTVSNLKLDAAMRTLYFDYDEQSKALAEYLRCAFTGSVVISTILCAAMLVFGEPLFALVFAHTELSFFPAGALAVSTAAINGCLAVYFVYLRNRLEFMEVMTWQLMVAVGSIVCQVAFVLILDLGLNGVLWGALLPAALTLLLVCVVRRGVIGVRIEWRRLLPSLRYSLPLVALAMGFMLATRLDRLILQHHVDLDVLGAYALLISVLGLQSLVLGALDNAIRPHVFADLKEKGTGAALAVKLYQELYCLVGLLALSVAILVGANLHLIVDDPGYLAMQSWLPYGATACVPLILGRYFALLYESQKRSIDLTASVVLRLTALFVSLEFLVPRFGAVGALTAILVAETLTALWLRKLAARRLGMKPPLRVVGLQIAVFLGGVWGSVYLIGEQSPALAGTLQFAIVVSLLLASNRRALRTLLNRTALDAPQLPLAEPPL